MLVTKQLTAPIDYHSIFLSYNGSQWGPSTSYQHSSKYLLLCSTEERNWFGE